MTEIFNYIDNMPMFEFILLLYSLAVTGLWLLTNNNNRHCRLLGHKYETTLAYGRTNFAICRRCNRIKLEET